MSFLSSIGSVLSGGLFGGGGGTGTILNMATGGAAGFLGLVGGGGGTGTILNMATGGAAGFLGLVGQPVPAKSEMVKQYGKTGAKYLKMLNAYGAGMPQQLAWQKEYQPKYDELAVMNMNDTLNGVNGKPGYLSLYENNVVPTITRATNAANTAYRTSNTNDLSMLGPDVLAAIKAANPGQTALMDRLTTDAMTGLDAGSQLTADQSRNVANSVNASAGARGVAYGPAASYEQVLANSGYGDQLKQTRTATAGTVAGLNNDFYTKQILAILGIDSKAPTAGQPLTANGTAAAGNSAGPTIFSNADSTGLFNAVFNQNAANSIAAKNNTAALEGAGISAVGSLASGALGFI